MRILRLATIAALCMLAGSVVFAAGNGRTEVIKKIPDVVVGAPIGSCGAFDILGDWVGLRQLTLLYDKNGVLVREGFHYRVIGQSRYYNSTDPSVEVLGGPGEVNPGSYNFVNGTLVSSGDIWKIKLPGYGVIFHETGRTVFDLATFTIQRDTGQNQFNDQDFAALCEALTP